jgi:hypothetical protein
MFTPARLGRHELKVVLLLPLAGKCKDEFPDLLTYYSLISSKIKLRHNANCYRIVCRPRQAIFLISLL